MLGFDKLDELRILSIINVCSKGYCVNRATTRNHVTLKRLKLFRFILDILQDNDLALFVIMKAQNYSRC